MRVVLQRVTQASVHIKVKEYSSIKTGILVLVGIEENDDETDVLWLSQKILNLRIFNDASGVMNLSIREVNGEILVVSQFTLFASTKKGNRPSYIKASRPEIAIPIYEMFIEKIRSSGVPVKTGTFGADMKVSITNDGPVTIIIDTKNKE
ncbi:MAG TPA: D-aminoacyl-tRNA deacylase [Bacteroidales bacterium]|nr:D-aminoacyl-tRNA deacylase [Bacteroidales bacterium]